VQSISHTDEGLIPETLRRLPFLSMTAEMTNNRFYVCSLCHMHFVADESFDSRRVRHDEWHMKARIQRRNTTQGIPTYKGGVNE